MDYIDNGNSVYIIMNKEYGNRVIIQEMGNRVSIRIVAVFLIAPSYTAVGSIVAHQLLPWRLSVYPPPPRYAKLCIPIVCVGRVIGTVLHP